MILTDFDNITKPIIDLPEKGDIVVLTNSISCSSTHYKRLGYTTHPKGQCFIYSGELVEDTLGVMLIDNEKVVPNLSGINNLSWIPTHHFRKLIQ